jgi:hypothetical protein
MTTTDTQETVVGAIGGAATGYVLWLVAYSIGDAITTVGRWSPIVLALSGVLAVCAGVWGWSLRRRGKRLWASFAFGLPVLPVILSLAVLADILF